MDKQELIQYKPQPGEVIPWQEKMKELPEIKGDPEILERIWKDNEALAYIYIWHCLLSF